MSYEFIYNKSINGKKLHTFEHPLTYICCSCPQCLVTYVRASLVIFSHHDMFKYSRLKHPDLQNNTKINYFRKDIGAEVQIQHMLYNVSCTCIWVRTTGVWWKLYNSLRGKIDILSNSFRGGRFWLSCILGAGWQHLKVWTGRYLYHKTTLPMLARLLLNLYVNVHSQTQTCIV